MKEDIINIVCSIIFPVSVLLVFKILGIEITLDTILVWVIFLGSLNLLEKK